MTRRMDTYRIGLRLFERSPWLGFGPGNFVVQYTSPEFRFDRSGVPSVCFNLFISVATQTGVAGLAALGATAASAFREARWVRHSYGADDAPLKQYAELLQVVLVALLLMSLFEPTDLQKSLWIVFGAIAAVGHLRRLQGVPSSSPP
jgi:O-antigen ligase